MRILSIDTTSMQGSLAVTDGARILAQEQQGLPGTHSEKLIQSVDHLLKLAGWKRDEVEGIAVAVGPGSFTGLRIGLATAKGMAMSVGCRIAGVSSLESLLVNGASFAGTVVALIDARRGEIYASACGAAVRGRRTRVMDECVLSPDDLVVRLKKIRGPLLLVGDGLEVVEAKVKRALGARAVLAQGSERMPQAANLAAIAQKKLAAGGDDLASLAPNYVRRSDAEIGFNKRHRPGTRPRGTPGRGGVKGGRKR
ncbi:MAG TPA: tRNA (adenosine(37)-N6)-threonylcarbamoyltransferase complex dimerization subunit type 1 TsaB [bacterium]|nr:tRNA (adenosine(37)-N6)-threonylcarbamoyltransferase complex dimerization subunit type 1 TsaB [bacterium]